MGAGGARAGSGRPKHSGKYREPTQPLRVPKSLISHIKSLLECHKENLDEDLTAGSLADEPLFRLKPAQRRALPLFGHSVAAGHPQRVEDHISESIDLNEYVATSVDHTFLLGVQGDSMRDAGIQDGDLLVVDSKGKAKPRSIVIAVVNGELTVKRLMTTKDGRLQLKPENPDFSVLTITDEMSFQILGVVSFVLHTL